MTAPVSGLSGTSPTPAVVPLHPQACPGRPDEVRWIVGDGGPPPVPPDAAERLPPPLADLVAEGVLAAVHQEPDGLRTRLAPGRSWARDGARVRTAVHAAVTGPARPDDEALRVAATELIDGPVGVVAGSHGGTIELVDVRGGVVRVRLTGACDGCPAAGVTLRLRLEEELRRRCPQLREVRAVPGAGGSGLFDRWRRLLPGGPGT